MTTPTYRPADDEDLMAATRHLIAAARTARAAGDDAMAKEINVINLLIHAAIGGARTRS